MLKTSLLYLIVNGLCIPVYIVCMFMGMFSSTVSAKDVSITELFMFYSITILPSILVFLFIHIWGVRFRFNRKLSVFLLVIVVVVLAYYDFYGPLQFGRTMKDLQG